MVLIALLIKFTSRGPILFQQARRGYRGRIFQVLKFRTMTVDAEQRLVDLESSNESAGGVLFKLRNDPRVTPLGAFLRRTSLDELPAVDQRAVRRDEPGRPPAPPAPRQRQAPGHQSRGLPSPPPGLARHHGALAGRRPERAGLRAHDRPGCRIRPELVAGPRPERSSARPSWSSCSARVLIEAPAAEEGVGRRSPPLPPSEEPSSRCQMTRRKPRRPGPVGTAGFPFPDDRTDPIRIAPWSSTSLRRLPSEVRGITDPWKLAEESVVILRSCRTFRPHRRSKGALPHLPPEARHP